MSVSYFPLRPSSVIVLIAAALTLTAPVVHAADCTQLPASPTPPANARSVTEFGAAPNDDRDDTEAIQRAFDSVKPGQWLVFPPGRYLHSKALWLRKQGVTLWGEGATLHATNPDDQAVLLAADDTSIYNFTLTAQTDKRRAAPWQSRIAVFERVNRMEPLRNNVVRGNKIVSSDDPKTPLANSASSAGIFVYRASNFLVAENLVNRSLSDAIHVTGGSRDGRVLNNVVRENGDDMIAVVSYLGEGPWTDASIEDEAKTIPSKRESHLVRNVLIANNNVAGQYWGRGISVVGGENVTIRDNTIADTTHGAAVYIAREPSYLTFGVRNVRVERNSIRNVQTTDPRYTVRSPVKTKHAAVEIYSRLLSDELEFPALVDALTVEHVLVANNTIDGVIADAIRVVPSGDVSMLTGQQRNGLPIVKKTVSGEVDDVAIFNNRIAGVSNGARFRFAGKAMDANDMACASNHDDGKGCEPTKNATSKITGASICSTP